MSVTTYAIGTPLLFLDAALRISDADSATDFPDLSYAGPRLGCMMCAGRACHPLIIPVLPLRS